MKIKQSPDDFVVEELTDRSPQPEGPFALYQLHKRGWTTPDALSIVRRRWNLDFRRVSYGGLKDRHADTLQHFTVFRGPARALEQQAVNVKYLGQTDAPFVSDDIRANRFRLVVRHLTPEQADAAPAAAEDIRRVGVPNYFDDQRFGSVAPDGLFVARPLIAGDFEAALKLALTAYYEFDRPPEKRSKKLLREHWGDWPTCLARLERSHARSIADYLAQHPGDYRGAVERLRPDLQGLYLAAYQSDIWNRVLARWLQRHLPAEQLVPIEFRRQALPAPTVAAADALTTLSSAVIPLPSARLEPPADADWLEPLNQVLAEEGLTLPEMKLKGLRKPFFSRGERPAFCQPTELMLEVGADELNKKRKKLLLAFDLPRGSYATLIIKRLVRG